MPTAALIRRTIKAAEQAGLEVTGVEVRPDGTLRVLANRDDSDHPAPAAEREKAACDELFGTGGGR
jgi:Tfp pilus assembly PilM family ATPase